jgi:HEAT repeat protein
MSKERWRNAKVVEILKESECKLAPHLLFDALFDERLRWRAADALSKTKPISIYKRLLVAARNENVEVRRVIAWLLGEFRRKEAVAYLIEILEDESEDIDVRRNSALGLGKIGVESSLPALIRALQNENLRWTAAQAIAMFDVKCTLPKLIELLRSRSVGLRIGATWALRLIRAPEAIQSLTEAINDSEQEVRKGAIWAIRQVAPQRIVELLIESIKYEDNEMRKDIVSGLSRIGAKDTIRRLEAAYKDYSQPIRNGIIELIREIKRNLKKKSV